jgi:hypothetical protein
MEVQRNAPSYLLFCPCLHHLSGCVALYCASWDDWLPP